MSLSPFSNNLLREISVLEDLTTDNTMALWFYASSCDEGRLS